MLIADAVLKMVHFVLLEAGLLRESVDHFLITSGF